MTTLDGRNGFSLSGADRSHHSGASVSSAGDINDDGIDDLIVGAPWMTSRTGGGYVVFGKDGGFTADLNFTALDGNNGFALVGVEQFTSTGTSVSSAGDINNDGIDDLIIGANEADDDDGASYVVFGSDGSFAPSLNLSALDGTNGFTISGDAAAGGFIGFGGDGADTLSGGDNDDLLYGGADADTLSGDLGADTFWFEASSGADVLTDFDSGEGDLLDLTSLGLSDLSDLSIVTSDGVTAITADGLDGWSLTLSNGAIPDAANILI